MLVIYLLAITAEAMSGALAAGRRNMDVFGVTVIAFVTALGGGTIRDMVLGHFPIGWTQHPEYVYLVIAAGLLARSAAHAIADGHSPAAIERQLATADFAAALDAFLVEEGALAWVRMSQRDGGLLHGTGYTFRVGATPRLPGMELAAEDYRRLARLALTDAPLGLATLLPLGAPRFALEILSTACSIAAVFAAIPLLDRIARAQEKLVSAKSG